MNSIITGGNSHYFKQLQVFVESLRINASFKGKVIICDNTIDGSWDKPGKYLDKGSFSESERLFFQKFDVKVVQFHELVERHNIARNCIDGVVTKHWAYPFKYVYTTLISKELLSSTRNICFFDADIYFQSPIDHVLDQFPPDRISLTSENHVINRNPIMKQWVLESNFEFGTSSALFESKMCESDNYCTGFFGGTAEIFNRYSLLCWMISTNSLVTYTNDQPLANILISFFDYPVKVIDIDFILHLARVNEEDIVFDEKKRRFVYNGVEPIVIHFNGGKGFLMDWVSVGESARHGPWNFGPLKRSLIKIRRYIKNVVRF